MDFSTFLVFFLGEKRLPFTTEGICLISKAYDLPYAFKSIPRLFVITFFEGACEDSVYEFIFDCIFDLFEERIEGSYDVGWIVLDHP